MFQKSQKNAHDRQDLQVVTAEMIEIWILTVPIFHNYDVVNQIS